MKKFISIFTIVMIAVLGTAIVLNMTNKVSKATEEEVKTVAKQVEELMKSYIDENGQYTKLTTLYSSQATHAGATGTRRTYYDEEVNALLMGDYDGGFEHINSGYAKESADVNNMQHYRNNAEEIKADNLFAARKVDYTVYNTNPIFYFDVLSEVAELSGSASASFWINNNGVFTYKNTEITSLHDSSNLSNYDELLKEFQYFAAPMLLVNDAIGFEKVVIYETNAKIAGEEGTVLVIKLLTNQDALISKAYVVPGLVFGDVEPEMISINTENWDYDDATERFAVHFFESDVYGQWLSMEQKETYLWEVELPKTYNEKVIFCRMNGESTINDWQNDHRWNQSVDESLDGRPSNDYYYFQYSSSGWLSDNLDGYVVVGSHQGWDNENINMIKLGNQGYMLEVELVEDDLFRIVPVHSWSTDYGYNILWSNENFEAGANDNNIKVKVSGTYRIYFHADTTSQMKIVKIG